ALYTPFLLDALPIFRIQTLNIRSRGVNCRRQVCQRALMIEHLHLDFGDELLRRLFIPFHSHKLLWLFLVATDVTAGFMVDHQTRSESTRLYSSHVSI